MRLRSAEWNSPDALHPILVLVFDAELFFLSPLFFSVLQLTASVRQHAMSALLKKAY